MKWVAAIVLAGVSAPPVMAQAPAASPPAAAAQGGAAQGGLNDKLINDPLAPWNAYGPNQKSVLLDTEGPKGYPATRVTITRKGAHAWDAGAGVPLPKAIAAGDVIYIAIYLRAPNIKDGETIELPFIGVGGPAPAYATIVSDRAAITNQWAQYYAVGTASDSYAAGATQATLHLAGDAQVIDVGPIRVFDLGKGFDTSRLPRNK